MLLCDKAYVKGGGKPRKIYCKATGGICVHVRYCSLSMKYYQTDNAKRCLVKEETDGKTE